MKNFLHKTRYKLRFYKNPAKKKLDIQLARSLSKKSSINKGVEFLIDTLSKYRKFKSNEKALFVGCRNPYEINYFKKHHQAQAIGIDLFSESKLIRIMDMHNLKFADNTFDLIFASHSLEHSYNPQRVVNEFIRVMEKNALCVIEVPVSYQIQGSDLIDFKNSKKVLKLFSKVKTKIIFEKITKKKENNTETDILSIIIKVEK